MDQRLQNSVIECVNQTADAIAALLYYFAAPEPFVYSLVDYLLLLGFEESMITIDFQTSQGERRVLQTMTEAELKFRGRPSAASPISQAGSRRETDVVYEQHQWEDLKEDGITFTLTRWIPRRTSTNLLLEVGNRLRSHYPDHYKHVRRLVRSFCEFDPRKVTDFTTDGPEASSHATSEYLELFRTLAWNGVISLLNLPDSALHTAGLAAGYNSVTDPPLNLFALVRYRPYTAYERTVTGEHGSSLTVQYVMRLMLADTQVEWLEKRSGKPRDEILRLFARPYDQERYWPADIAFRSGTIYSGVKAVPRLNGTAPLNPEEKERRRLESKLYAAFGKGARLVYFPIHIGGTPWITLYSLHSPKHQTDWMHFLHLYRQVIPRIADELRGFARKGFIHALVDAVRAPVQERAKWDSRLIKQINQSWRDTSLVFPFPAPQVQAIDKDTQHTSASGGFEFEIGDTAYEVSFANAQTYFPSEVGFDQLNKEIKGELTQRISIEIASRYKYRVLHLHGVLNLAHELKNAILETHWDELRKELDIMPTEELFRSDYPVRLRRGLSHMLWPAALVGLVSNLGKIDLIGDELETFRETHLEINDAFRYDASDVQERYRESVRYLTNYLARLKWPDHHRMSIREYVGREPLDQAVANRKLDDLLLHAEEIPDALLELQKLRFPPLKDGIPETQGTRFAVASLLSEPIRNAAAAMMSNTGRSVPAPTLIWSVHAEEREITVWIANTFPTDARADALLWSTSIELVNALGRMLGIGSVDAPRSVHASHDDIQLIVTVVHLRPDRLGYHPNRTRAAANPLPRTHLPPQETQ